MNSSTLLNRDGAGHPHPLSSSASLSFWRRSALLGAVMLLWLVGCTAMPTAQTSADPTPDAFNGSIADLADYTLPTPVPTTRPDLTVIVNTQNSRANVRSGPGTSFPIVAKANPGDAFEVVAKSEDNTWWQICCPAVSAPVTDIVTDTVTDTVTGTAESNTDAVESEDNTGWIADSVVRVAGEDEAVAISRPLLDAELAAEWQVDWECGSDRCEIKSCAATVEAKVNRTVNQQLLPVEHQVTWDETCFDADTWVFEVNQFTGEERTGEYKDNFLYSYWLGREPGAANGVYTLAEGEAAAVHCAGPHAVEIEEGGGWTTIYEGNTCHDVRTGLLVYLAYNKRWLFSGEFEGKQYERAYFGDYEALEQKLTATNVELFFVEEK
jgi:hypothetical protein